MEEGENGRVKQIMRSNFVFFYKIDFLQISFAKDWSLSFVYNV